MVLWLLLRSLLSMKSVPSLSTFQLRMVFALPTQWSSRNIAAVWGLACFEEPVAKSVLCMPLKCMKIIALLAWAWPVVT